MKKAIILFSGGLDSTTCLALAQSQGFACYALTFSYGQKHSVEITQAKKIAEYYNVVEHKILHLPIGEEIGGSSLTDQHLSVPDHSEVSGIPNTYVPARNTIFLSFALSWGEVIEAYDIFFGANYIDYSQYPDCRPDYLEAFETLAQMATKVGASGGSRFKIHAPLLSLNKAQIILEGQRLGIDYSQTLSCYRADASGRSCGKCDSCTYRKKGFSEANLVDPTIYY